MANTTEVEVGDATKNPVPRNRQGIAGTGTRRSRGIRVAVL